MQTDISATFIKRTDVSDLLGVSNPTAGNLIDAFCQMGILVDRNPQKMRNKMYAFDKYLAILNKGTELE